MTPGNGRYKREKSKSNKWKALTLKKKEKQFASMKITFIISVYVFELGHLLWLWGIMSRCVMNACCNAEFVDPIEPARVSRNSFLPGVRRCIELSSANIPIYSPHKINCKSDSQAHDPLKLFIVKVLLSRAARIEENPTHESAALWAHENFIREEADCCRLALHWIFPIQPLNWRKSGAEKRRKYSFVPW